MSVCLNNMPAGVASDCTRALAKIRNIIIAQKSETGFTLGGETVQATWTAKFNDAVPSKMWMPVSVAGSEDTSPGAVEIETANGEKYITFDKPPSMNVMIEVNAEDMIHVRSVLTGGNYQVYFTTMDGQIVGTVNSSNKFVGFGARSFAPVNVPSDDAIHEKNLINIMFSSTEEFRNAKVIKPAWNPQVILPAAVPVGLELEIRAASATEITAFVNTRGGSGYEGVVDADWVIADDTNSVTISGSDDGDGVYTLTLTGTATTGTLQVAINDTVYTHVSDKEYYEAS